MAPLPVLRWWEDRVGDLGHLPGEVLCHMLHWLELLRVLPNLVVFVGPCRVTRVTRALSGGPKRKEEGDPPLLSLMSITFPALNQSLLCSYTVRFQTNIASMLSALFVESRHFPTFSAVVLRNQSTAKKPPKNRTVLQYRKPHIPSRRL